MYRLRAGEVQVLLAHPGGPYWARRDDGAWSIPKGEYAAGESALHAACREFSEETGFSSQPPYQPLGEVRLKSGKRITAWAFAGEADPGALACNTFEIEWPPRSGRRTAFPEIDRAAWFCLRDARRKLVGAQAPFIEALATRLGVRP